jgi:hypothetical protein
MMTTDNLVEVNCEIPMQCELIDKDENRDMVTHVLKEDAKFLKFITTFTGTGKWSYVINNGVISQLPLVYFYFIKYKYVASTGKRTVKVGFVCWARGIYATIDIDFNVYPKKSVYVNPHKAWCLPHSDITYRIKILSSNQQQAYENSKTYVRAFTISLMSVMRLCAKYDVTEIRQACFSYGLSSYPSYRLANLLVYNQKLVSKVWAFMLLNCSCSFKTIANIPYCGCETLCSEIIPKQFGDAGRMCSSDVLFCDSK